MYILHSICLLQSSQDLQTLWWSDGLIIAFRISLFPFFFWTSSFLKIFLPLIPLPSSSFFLLMGRAGTRLQMSKSSPNATTSWLKTKRLTDGTKQTYLRKIGKIAKMTMENEDLAEFRVNFRWMLNESGVGIKNHIIPWVFNLYFRILPWKETLSLRVQIEEVHNYNVSAKNYDHLFFRFPYFRAEWKQCFHNFKKVTVTAVFSSALNEKMVVSNQTLWAWMKSKRKG